MHGNLSTVLLNGVKAFMTVQDGSHGDLRSIGAQIRARNGSMYACAYLYATTCIPVMYSVTCYPSPSAQQVKVSLSAVGRGQHTWVTV